MEADMTVTLNSIIEKGAIRLPDNIPLPDGTKVIVRIDPISNMRGKREIFDELSGAWSNDTTIIKIFQAIEEERHCYHGRSVSFE